MEQIQADDVDSPGPSSSGARSSRRRTITRLLGFMTIGLSLMMLSAGLAWWVRARAGDEDEDGAGKIARLEGSAHLNAADTRRAMNTHSNSDSIQFKTGRLAYQVHCARCHGPEGRGDGADSAALRPAPRDFASSTWSHGSSPEAVRAVILQGIPGTAMTGWGHLLSPQQLDAVVHYVRSLGPSPRDTDVSGSSDPGPLHALLQRAGFEPAEPKTVAPAVRFEDLNGQAQSLEQDKGRTILLVFWGTTCAPCVEELPDLDRLAAEFAGVGLVVRPLCVDEADEPVLREIAAKRTKSLGLFVDRTGLTRLRYDVQTLPSAVLIDSDGHLLGRAQGGRDWAGEPVRALLRAVVREPDKAE